MTGKELDREITEFVLYALTYGPFWWMIGATWQRLWDESKVEEAADEKENQ